MGIEAISRGANEIYFVDNSYKAIRIINDNISKLKSLKTDFNAGYNIIKSDTASFLKKPLKIKFDIIFIDPPYKITAPEMTLIFKLLRSGNLIHKDTLLIYEYFSKRNVEDEISGLKVIKNSFFGDKIVSYLAE
jgi:16S rRNA G966 N2-methylase RsmD